METVTRGKTTFTKPSDTELVAVRVIDAPRQLVWDAHAKCEHAKQWLLGPDPGWSMPQCDVDLRPGGTYRYMWAGPAESFTLSGEYREVVEPERIVNTERYNDQEPATLNTLTLTDEGGKTRLTTTIVYPSKDVREEVVATGMEEGWDKSYDLLEEYLRGLK